MTWPIYKELYLSNSCQNPNKRCNYKVVSNNQYHPTIKERAINFFWKKIFLSFFSSSSSSSSSLTQNSQPLATLKHSFEVEPELIWAFLTHDHWDIVVIKLKEVFFFLFSFYFFFFGGLEIIFFAFDLGCSISSVE